MRNLLVVSSYAIFGWVVCQTANADPLNLFPPPPPFTSFQGQDIGNFGIGTVFDATANFSINSAAIQFNPFGNATSDLLAVIYTVTVNSDNNGIGDINFSPAGCNVGTNAPPGTCTAVAGTNAPVGVANSAVTSITDAGQQFYSVPLNFSFVAGTRYAVEFFANSDQTGTAQGWGTGATARNKMTFWEYDPSISGYASFTAGPTTVLDGAYVGDGGIRNMNFPAVQLNTVVPEPRMVGLLLGACALILFPLARKRMNTVA